MSDDSKLKMRFKGHQSFFLRKGWLSKGLKGVLDNGALFMPSCSKEAMDELGLGSNQVVALRYWLHAMGLIEMGFRNRMHHITELGELMLAHDPYIEEEGTLWALHCNLATSQEEAASWYFLFNEFNMNSFGRDDFVHAIEKYIFTYNARQNVAVSSLESDFSCILSTYIPHDKMSGGKRISPESVIDCPLGELGLIDIDNEGLHAYRKKPANLSTLPSLLVLYTMCPHRETLESDGYEPQREIRLDRLLSDPCMPGRLFNLDSVALLTKLYELENDGYLRINRTAGLDVIRLAKTDMTKEDCLEGYYELIG